MAFQEFTLVTDADRARAALQESGPAARNPDGSYGLYKEIHGGTR